MASVINKEERVHEFSVTLNFVIDERNRLASVAEFNGNHSTVENAKALVEKHDLVIEYLKKKVTRDLNKK